jgi:hypothetical protein
VNEYGLNSSNVGAACHAVHVFSLRHALCVYHGDQMSLSIACSENLSQEELGRVQLSAPTESPRLEP